MSRPLWFNKLLTKTFPQSRMVARMTNWPMVGGWLDDWLFKDDDLFLVPRQKIVSINRSVPGQEQTCAPYEVVEHFIREANFHWVMDECNCRAGMHCKDYPVKLGCIFLGEAARQINPRIGRQVSMDEALSHARKCREAGLVHLMGRNKLDAVWLGAGPGEKLLTICNCCPCCCIWNNLPWLSKDITRKITRMPGVSVIVNDNCTGCGECAEGVCFAGALSMQGGRAVISDACRGCGRCAMECGQEAIEITVAGDQLIEQSIARISRAVDVK